MNYGLEIELLTADKNKLKDQLERAEEECGRWKERHERALAEGRHAKACFDAAQEQAVRLAGQVDRLRAENATQLEEIVSLGGNRVFLLEQENAGLKEELEAFKRLRDELIELNDRLKSEENRALSFGLNPSDTPRTDADTIACGWDTTQPVVPKTFAQELERECAHRERNRREIQKEWERSHDAWRNAIVRCETLLVALKETNALLASETMAWTVAKTEQMRRNNDLIGEKPASEIL